MSGIIYNVTLTKFNRCYQCCVKWRSDDDWRFKLYDTLSTTTPASDRMMALALGVDPSPYLYQCDMCRPELKLMEQEEESDKKKKKKKSKQVEKHVTSRKSKSLQKPRRSKRLQEAESEKKKKKKIKH